MTVLESIQRSNQARVARYYSLIRRAESTDDDSFGNGELGELGDLAFRLGKPESVIANDLSTARRWHGLLAQAAKFAAKSEGIGAQVMKLEFALKDAVVEHRESASTAEMSRGRVGAVEHSKLRQQEAICRSRVSELQREFKDAQRVEARVKTTRKQVAELQKSHPWLAGG